MGKIALLIVTAMLLLRSPAVAFAQAQNPTPSSGAALQSAVALNRILGVTAWDDDYFYIALQINKPTLNGKNNQPFSNPLEDDAALISLQTDDDHKAAQRTAHSFLIAVSAAGGAQLYSGSDKQPLFNGLPDIQAHLDAINKNVTDVATQQAKREALLASLIKFQVTPQGAPLSGGAHAPGYTLEVAVPWSDLGGKPEPGTKMGFLVAAQSTVGGSPQLQSLAPQVRGASDLDNPSLWTEVLFSNAPDVVAPGAIVCPRVFANKPVIDGDLSTGEWLMTTAFEFGERISGGGSNTSLGNTLAARVRPEFAPHASRPVVPIALGSAESLALPPHRPQRVPPLVLARYVYWYQADPRKAAPAEQVLRTDGSSALVHHPLEGTGPWFSYDRADWHRHQLLDIRRAGIDVILPVFRGAPRDRQLYARKGLLALVTALRSLHQSGEDYPQVALYLDTNSLIETLGSRPDLREPATQAALYAMIRDFYQSIPAVFRAVVPLTAENGGRTAYPVFFSDSAAFSALDDSFTAYVRGRFAADFGGTDLILLGESGFKAGAKLDGYFTETKEKGFQFDSDGWIKMADVGAGYDNTLADSSGIEKPLVRFRHDGKTYRDDWMAAIAKRPDWVLLDSWNDYGDGAELAPTLETGYSYADLTQVFTHQFAGDAPRSLKFLWHDVPATLLAGATYAVEARVQNTGTQSWGPTSNGNQIPVVFAYRWRQGGQTLATGASSPLSAPIFPSQRTTITMLVAATGSDGAALPAGDYTLEIDAVEASKRGEGDWFGAAGGSSQSLQLPVHVRAHADMPEWAASLVQTDLPTTLESGSVYEVHATLRNDGARPWRKAEGARVTLRLYRTDLDTKGAAHIASTPVDAADATAELTQDVLPGQEASVRLLLPLTDPQGQPLPVWKQEDFWTYTARWEVAADMPTAAENGQAVVAAASENASEPSGRVQGISIAPTPVAVVAFDFGVRFTVNGTLSELPGERRVPVRLGLENVGPQTWKKGLVRVGYHWYYLDGSEFIWEDETTALPADVPPGGRVNDLLAWVTPPPYDGTYWLVWDVKVGDTWASTTASDRPFDELVNQVEVVRGRLTFADLSKAYNLDGITEEDDLTGGDFDGYKDTFPATLIPPFASAALAPTGMWLASAKTGPESDHHISFRWGPKGGKALNFIACRGQKVLLGKSGDQCRVLHILAASTGKDSFADLKLFFQEPTSESEDVYSFGVSRWDAPPTHGEEVAYLLRYHHGPNGVRPGKVALYHYTIRIREPRKLVWIQLPNAPEIKIAAISLEK
jgi:hypothetical protein